MALETRAKPIHSKGYQCLPNCKRSLNPMEQDVEKAHFRVWLGEGGAGIKSIWSCKVKRAIDTWSSSMEYVERLCTKTCGSKYPLECIMFSPTHLLLGWRHPPHTFMVVVERLWFSMPFTMVWGWVRDWVLDKKLGIT